MSYYNQQRPPVGVPPPQGYPPPPRGYPSPPPPQGYPQQQGYGYPQPQYPQSSPEEDNSSDEGCCCWDALGDCWGNSKMAI